MNNRYYPLEEATFKQEIEPYIALHYKRPGRQPAISHYQFFCAILYVLRTGISWRDMPPCYGHWHTLYKTRSAIERSFARVKENKRLVARFDKLDYTFFSFFALACLKILNLLC